MMKTAQKLELKTRFQNRYYLLGKGYKESNSNSQLSNWKIHPLNKYLLWAFYEPGSVLVLGGINEQKTRKDYCPFRMEWP